VDRFHRESRHIFIPARTLIYDINHKLSYLPEWKKHQYTEKYLTVDEEELAKALVFRDLDGQKYVYWKPVYDDERDIERAVRQLAGRANIPLQAPVTEGSWRTWLTDNDSVLAKKAPKDYKDAIAGQVEVCQTRFRQCLSRSSFSARCYKNERAAWHYVLPALALISSPAAPSAVRRPRRLETLGRRCRLAYCAAGSGALGARLPLAVSAPGPAARRPIQPPCPSP